MPADRFLYSGIRVRSMARSLRFYRRLGFRILKRGTFSHGGRWVHLVYPGSPHRLELNYYPPGTPFYTPYGPGEQFDHFGFYSPDPNRWLRRTIRAGARPTVGFVDGPVALLFVRDPDGVWLGTFGPATPRRSRVRRRRPVTPATSRAPRPTGRRRKRPARSRSGS